MIEHPSIGAESEVVLEENMILSLHPQVVDEEGRICLYTQDTYRVGKTGAENLCDIPWKTFDGSECKSVA
jgi:Xaa-Pro aminopeptidase